MINYEGKSVYVQSYSNQSSIVLSAMSLPPGLYLLKIRDKNNYFIKTTRLSVIE
jgi:hypothetical protein